MTIYSNIEKQVYMCIRDGTFRGPVFWEKRFMELDMTKGSPSKLITKFIIPIIIGNIFQQLYSMVDTIIVGRFVGVDALAAVGATGSVSFLILGFTQGLTTGFTVLTAQRFGAGDREGMRKSIGSAAILSVIVTIVMLSLIHISEPTRPY